MSWLRETRLSRLQLAGLTAVSIAATALIIADALGRSDAQTAALQALRHRPEIVEQHPPQSPAAAAQPTPTTNPAPIAPAAFSAPGSSPSGGPAPTSAPASVSASSGNASPGPATSPSGPTNQTTPHHKVGHIFVIALSTTSFHAAFGQGSLAPYLSQTLRRNGTLLAGYQTLGASELPDYLAMISGQAPNADTQGECSTYAEFPSGTSPAADGLVPGLGCVYPNTVLTIGDQVTATGHIWRGYIQDMDPATCVHPNSDAIDDAPLPGAGAEYATRHNPFIYFHSLLDLGGCASDDVSLTQLPADLRSASTTPTYSYIAPEACLDASGSSCPDGGPAGLAGEDAFLRQWVPRILHSKAYKRDGVLIIAFSGPGGQTPQAGDAPIPTGALVLSRYARRGKTVSTTYDPYSLLRSVEDLLGYKPLGRAQSAGSFVARAFRGLR